MAPPGNFESTHNDADSVRLVVLRLLARKPELSQRDLATELGVSLGKTNYVLHALLDKGFLKMRNFRRSDNKVAYAYVLTPSGIREKLRMTRAFLQRKEIEFDSLRHTINALASELNQEREGN